MMIFKNLAVVFLLFSLFSSPAFGMFHTGPIVISSEQINAPWFLNTKGGTKSALRAVLESSSVQHMTPNLAAHDSGQFTKNWKKWLTAVGSFNGNRESCKAVTVEHDYLNGLKEIYLQRININCYNALLSLQQEKNIYANLCAEYTGLKNDYAFRRSTYDQMIADRDGKNKEALEIELKSLIEGQAAIQHKLTLQRLRAQLETDKKTYQDAYEKKQKDLNREYKEFTSKCNKWSLVGFFGCAFIGFAASKFFDLPSYFVDSYKR